MTREFWALWSADFLLRGPYQLGKTPVLPLLAASLGAGEVLVGLAVSASTCTGIVAKPVFGWLSDLRGRRVWLWAALAMFVAMPFAYPLVAAPGQLLQLRVAHGLATAILGPVALSWVVAMSPRGRAARLGVFGMARGGAHLLAPSVAGALLTALEPAEIYPLAGALSLLAVAPLLLLGSDAGARAPDRPPAPARVIWRRVARMPTLWCAGGLETLVFVASYATRAFLPLAVIQQPGGGTVMAGLFLTVQEASHLLCRPLGGRFADRFGIGVSVPLGMSVTGAGLMALPGATGAALLACAIAAGAGQGLALPATAAMAGSRLPEGMTGAGMGIYGALRNAGKIAGPIIAGLLTARYGIDGMFSAMAALLMIGAASAAAWHWLASTSGARLSGSPGISQPAGRGFS